MSRIAGLPSAGMVLCRLWTRHRPRLSFPNAWFNPSRTAGLADTRCVMGNMSYLKGVWLAAACGFITACGGGDGGGRFSFVAR